MSYADTPNSNSNDGFLERIKESIPLFEGTDLKKANVTGKWSFAERFIGWSSLYLFLETIFLFMLIGCLLVNPRTLYIDIISYWLIPTIAIMTVVIAATSFLKITAVSQIHKWSKGVYYIIVVVCMGISIIGSIVLCGGTAIVFIMHYISPWTLWENGVSWGWEFAYSILMMWNIVTNGGFVVFMISIFFLKRKNIHVFRVVIRGKAEGKAFENEIRARQTINENGILNVSGKPDPNAIKIGIGI